MLASSSTMYDTERTEGCLPPSLDAPSVCSAQHFPVTAPFIPDSSAFSLQIKRTESSPPRWFCALV